jgi:hypothetical protein
MFEMLALRKEIREQFELINTNFDRAFFNFNTCIKAIEHIEDRINLLEKRVEELENGS